MHGDLSAGAEAMRDLNEVRSFLSSGAVSNPLDAICAPVLLAVMFLLHPAFGWLGVLGISVLVMVGIVTDVLVRPALTKAAAQRAQAGHQLAAGLREPELTEGMGMFAAMARRWARRHGEALEEARDAGELAQRVAAIAKIIRLALMAGVMVVGVVLILSHQASAGSLMGGNLLLGKVLGPFDALVSSWRRWIETGAAWQRVSRLLGTAAEPVTAAASAGDHEAGLMLQDVGYRIPGTGRTILQGITLALPPGTCMALVGANGAGKSTLLRLLVGLLSPSEGSVRLDGVDVTASDRSHFGYLPQGIHLQ
jgi:ATP-binding cassette subfamily C protein